MRKKNKIIYILGAERSGSTLLNVVLGNNNQIASFGELQYFPEAVIDNHVAYWNTTVLESEFWVEIISIIQQNFGSHAFEEYQELRLKYERFRKLPLLFFHYFIKAPSLLKYWEYNSFLSQILIEKTKKTYICDSSKNMVRYIALNLSGQFELKPILITRISYGYCWSKKKKSVDNEKLTSCKKSSLNWSFNNLLFQLFSFFYKIKVKIKYEDFCKEPVELINKLESELKIPFSDIKNSIKKKDAFIVENFIAGNNNVRSNKNLKINYDESWKSALTKKELKEITIFSFLMLKILKYETYS